MVGRLSSDTAEKESGNSRKTNFTARGIIALAKPGYHADPDNKGLYLQITKFQGSITKSWIFRFSSPVTLKRREMGIGSLDAFSLANARLKAYDLRRLILDGIDPLEQRILKRTKAIEANNNSITFADAADSCIKTKQAEWSNLKHKDQWVSTIKTYALPIIGKLKVDQITTAHIVKLLEQEIKKKNGEVEGTFW